MENKRKRDIAPSVRNKIPREKRCERGKEVRDKGKGEGE